MAMQKTTSISSHSTLLSNKEVMDVFKVTRVTLYDWRNNLALPFINVAEGLSIHPVFGYPPDKIMNWAQENDKHMFVSPTEIMQVRSA